MKLKAFKELLASNIDKLEQAIYHLADDSTVTMNRPVSIPQSALTSPFFHVTLYLDTGSEDFDPDEFGSYMVENSQVSPKIMEPSDPIPPARIQSSSQDSEIERARLFYETMTGVNNKAYEEITKANNKTFETVIGILQKNEDRLDKRLKTMLNTYEDGRGDDPDDSPVVTPPTTVPETLGQKLAPLVDIFGDRLQEKLKELSGGEKDDE